MLALAAMAGSSIAGRDADGAWARDIGTWDPLPAPLAVAYRLAGREDQRAFWGTDERRSMLVQLARRRES